MICPPTPAPTSACVRFGFFGFRQSHFIWVMRWDILGLFWHKFRFIDMQKWLVNIKWTFNFWKLQFSLSAKICLLCIALIDSSPCDLFKMTLGSEPCNTEDFGSGVEFFRGFCTLPVLSRPPMFPNFWLFPPFVQEQPSSHQRLCSERLPCSSISSWLQLRVWSEFFFHPLILCCLSAFVMQKVKFRRWVYLFYCASKITAEKADEHRNLLEYEQCHQNSD